MKRLIVCLCALACAAGTCQAATLQVSNLSESLAVAQFIQADRTWATTFTTAGDATLLNSAVLRLSLPGGTPAAPLVVSIRQDNGAFPGPILTQLSGSSPTVSTGQLLTYTPTSPFVLGANTTYWMTVSNAAPGPLAYLWLTTASNNQSSPSGWTIGDTMALSVNGGTTWQVGSNSSGLFAVHTDPVPEPAAALLMVLGGIALVAIRRRLRPRS